MSHLLDVAKAKKLAHAKAERRRTLKNPRIWVVFFTIFPIAIPIAALIFVLRLLAGWLSAGLEWFDDAWYDLMAPVRAWIERGQKPESLGVIVKIKKV